MMQRTLFEGFPTCYKIENETTEVVVTTEVGPRILYYGFKGGPNMFGLCPEMEMEHENGIWKPYGGHRFWAAPEGNPRTYTPDNEPIDYAVEGDFCITLRPALDRFAGLQKEMRVRLDGRMPKTTVEHKLINRNQWPTQVAPWGLSIMAGGGTGIIPQEPYISHADELLPARAMVMWHYTKLQDPRWTWGDRFIRLQCDPSLDTPQKIGIMNKQGWAAYHAHNCLFVKTYPYRDSDTYPDMGSNTEFFTKADFFEAETLGPLVLLHPGEEIVHTETWYLFKDMELPGDDDALAEALTEPLRVALG